MKKIVTVALALFTLSACGKKTSEKENTKRQPVDKLVSTQWCHVDKITENFHIVSRYSFTRGAPNKTKMSYLRIDDNGSPIIYNLEKEYDWVPKTDDLPAPDLYSVELVENELKMRGASQQKEILEQILRKNSNLKPSVDGFNPKLAVSLKYRRASAAKDSEQIMYPCTNYSESFIATEPVRPIMEFNVFFGQSVWEKQIGPKNASLAKQMSFKFPMEQLHTSEVAVEGSSWCSWFQIDLDRFMVNVITFGKEKFAKNEATDLIFRDDFPDFPGALESIFKGMHVYSISKNQKYILGETTWDWTYNDSTVKMRAQEIFAPMQDSNGSIALVQLNSYDPAAWTSLRHFDNIYFKCDDPRPLERNAFTKKNLPKLIELQKNMLQQ